MSIRENAIIVADWLSYMHDGDVEAAATDAQHDDLDRWEHDVTQAGVPVTQSISPLIPVVRTVLRERSQVPDPFTGFPTWSHGG
jgi:hypothetical protein